jgi:DNA mismatch repair protein MutL
MGKIRVLSEETINQIAAGEVVENPAAVVKELVENAIDARATHIRVEVKGGGFQKICVIDDGCGMEREDALLALERHATSKICSVDDLQNLGTMGFRGEALASMGAVARMTLITAVQEGVKIDVEGGRVVSLAVSARTRGTTVEVEDLFYNVPARKKFQKSTAASNSDIHRVMSALSLAHPEIGFELVGVFSVPRQGLKERIQEVLGDEFVKSAIAIDHGGVTGFVAAPQNSRSNRTGQYLFINRRSVVAPSVAFAVKDALGTQISNDRYPMFVLHFELAAHLVDVNVHPQKKEVRFQDEAGVKRLFRESVARAFFGKSEAIPTAVSTETWMSALKFREEPTFGAESWLWEEAPPAIGLWDHFLLIDAQLVEGYESGILLIDLWAAEERLTYEKVKEQGESQRLLVPLTIELLPEEVRENELKRLGFVLQQIGKTTWAVEAIPPFLDEQSATSAIRAVSQEESYEKMALRITKCMRKKEFVLQEAWIIWQKLFRLPNWSASVRYLNRCKIESMASSSKI